MGSSQIGAAKTGSVPIQSFDCQNGCVKPPQPPSYCCQSWKLVRLFYTTQSSTVMLRAVTCVCTRLTSHVWDCTCTTCIHAHTHSSSHQKIIICVHLIVTRIGLQKNSATTKLQDVEAWSSMFAEARGLSCYSAPFLVLLGRFYFSYLHVHTCIQNVCIPVWFDSCIVDMDVCMCKCTRVCVYVCVCTRV